MSVTLVLKFFRENVLRVSFLRVLRKVFLLVLIPFTAKQL